MFGAILSLDDGPLRLIAGATLCILVPCRVLVESFCKTVLEFDNVILF